MAKIYLYQAIIHTKGETIKSEVCGREDYDIEDMKFRVMRDNGIKPTKNKTAYKKWSEGRLTTKIIKEVNGWV